MKTRILFVDGDAASRKGLQRRLSPLEAVWEMEFVDSGEKALDRLRKEHFTAVVTDLRLPRMGGAEFLGEVLKQHPQTLRLVLAGPGSRDQALQCVGSIHQCLSKPCQPDDLKRALQRVHKLETTVESDALRELICQMDHLPTLPDLSLKLVELCQRPESGSEEVAQLIAGDLGMTAQILKLVNSAFFGLSRTVSDMSEAVGYLGIETVKNLVLSVQAFAQFPAVDATVLVPQRLWNHSLTTAALAKAIARQRATDRKVADDAFVAGLLHDAGKLVLASNYRECYRQVIRTAREKDITISAAERGLFATSHAEVGGYLFGLWGLPATVVEAIAWHHTPRRNMANGITAVTAVHVADCLARESDPEVGLSGWGQCDLGYLAALGLPTQFLEWRSVLEESHPAG